MSAERASSDSAGVTRLAVRVTPGASDNTVTREVTDMFGAVRLRVRLQAPAIEGRANKALIEVLADALQLRKSALTLAAGMTGRDKAVNVTADPDALRAAVAALPVYGS